MTRRARHAAAIRHGARSRTVFTTRPFRSTNTTSIAKRMNAVWTARHGEISSADPEFIPSRPSRPRLRVSRVSAISTSRAIIALVRSLMSIVDVTRWPELSTTEDTEKTKHFLRVLSGGEFDSALRPGPTSEHARDE